MQDFFEARERRGYDQGYAQAYANVNAYANAKRAAILLNLIKKGNITKDAALEEFGGTYEELEKAAASICNWK